LRIAGGYASPLLGSSQFGLTPPTEVVVTNRELVGALSEQMGRQDWFQDRVDKIEA
jgi:hypothetical protein